ncbi:hypothetical protein [Actinacidiphila acidipaludis]|uniref:Uncharacterized protein n=1 Tax=Actinacidiphila acidipaludis TaxID=2873382 RepID=A0ABS7Q533_9ACTN|nr:hypothetical protein [Streptomyces acidipaludis]MBY8878073.1 hypothetical protein [Streptomyces acidipaludis]
MSAEGASLGGVGAAVDLMLLPAVAARGPLDALGAALTGARETAGRIRSSAGEAVGILRQLKAEADAGARSVVAAARGATSAATGLTSLSASAKRIKTGLRALDGKVGGLLSLVSGMVLAVPQVAKLMDAFGKAMTIASAVMTAVNLLSRTTPIGAITGLLLPLASQLIDLAVNSETGQKLMEQVATAVLQGIPALLKIMGPVLKIAATVVGTYFTVYLTVVVDVLKVLAAVVKGGFEVMHALLTGDVGRLRSIASGALQGLRDAVRPVTDWFTRGIPDAFTRVKDAVSHALSAAGGILETGAQSVAGVAKAPLQGLIAFVNWIIRGLNKLSFSFLGKHFGVHLSEIPMLAEGGIVLPGAAQDAHRVLPLTALDRQLALAASLHRTRPATGRRRIQQYRETATLGARGTAEELLFLAALPAA